MTFLESLRLKSISCVVTLSLVWAVLTNSSLHRHLNGEARVMFITVARPEESKSGVRRISVVQNITLVKRLLCVFTSTIDELRIGSYVVCCYQLVTRSKMRSCLLTDPHDSSSSLEHDKRKELENLRIIS
jgi:hypothetical protein